ncbi:unnamed protein product, partial [marine sediment metagenome]
KMLELLTTPVIEWAQWKSRLHGPKPQPSNLYFTEAWPDPHKWAKNKYWEIKETAPVSYDKGYILPGDDLVTAGISTKNLDLSNATNGLKLYPESEGVAYEILIGLKPGNYQIGLYIPGVNDYLLALGDTSMYPDLTDDERKYLAAITPEDSPYANPLLKLWFIKDMAAWILKLYVLEGVEFEKCILGFRVAKHRLAEISKPDVFSKVDYFTTLRGTW